MIKLKSKINKSATMRELRKEAEKGYKHSWQPEIQVEAFMKGAEALLNLLHLPRVVLQSEQLCDNPHCEDGIVDRDMYGHPIYCQVCDSHN